MNRREFTTSRAALAAAPALPFAAVAPAAATPAVPAGAYAWAQLIARAQNKCSPAMLAQHLNLRADVATSLFNEMLRDGVLRAPNLVGIARATAPIKTMGIERGVGQRAATKAKEILNAAGHTEEQSDETPPLVNAGPQGLGCADTSSEDLIHARTDQSPQESPERG